ncbi:MAG: glycosyltransferase family 2 protein [Patescibacteria group bacterium]|nr:glycosyltransferase family 2 protein [Patescibacteria group bacterium]
MFSLNTSSILKPKIINPALSRNKPPISVVIVTYKSNRWIGKCLNSLVCNKVKPSEIIVIDNSSPRRPKTIVNKIQKKYQRSCSIRYLENPKNLGFAKAANQGAALSKGKYLLFINPDFFIDKSAIKIMTQFIKTKDNIGAIGGSVLEHKKRTAQRTVARNPSLLTLIIEFTSFKKIFALFGFKKVSGFWDYRIFDEGLRLPLAVDAVSGCFMLVKKSVFNQLGGFDENFFLYLEDLDFCIRLKQANFQNFYLPNATGEHISGASSILKPHHIDQKSWDKSKRYFVRKQFSFSGEILSCIFEIDNLLTNFKKRIEGKTYA